MMKKYAAIFTILLFLFAGCSQDFEDTESETGLGPSPFHTGGTFTDTAANSISNAVDDNANDIDDLVSLTGMAANSTNFGSFTGSTITDSQALKPILQELETAVESAVGGGLLETDIDTEAELEAVSNTQIATESEAQGYVTFERLNAISDVGTGSAQLAQGNHLHAGVYEPYDTSIIKAAELNSEAKLEAIVGTAIATETEAQSYASASLDGDEWYLVMFSDINTLINSPLYYDAVNAWIGFGTTAPHAPFELASSVSPTVVLNDTDDGFIAVSAVTGAPNSAFFFDNTGELSIRSQPKSAMGTTGNDTKRLIINGSTGLVGIPGTFELATGTTVDEISTTVTSSSTDDQIPTAKAVYDVIAAGDIPASTFTADGDILVGTGSGTYAAESGATARASLGLDDADNIPIDTTNFDNNLSSANTDLQSVLDTLDETAGGSGIPASTMTADGDFIVGTGSGTYAAESGATARTSLGLDSAALRAAEDTLTNGANLPDGEAITTYVSGSYPNVTLAGGTESASLSTQEITFDAWLEDIAAMTDPDSDRILFWDDSAGAVAQLAIGTGLSISATTMSIDISSHEAATNPHPNLDADNIALSTTNFDNNLSASEDNLQAAMDVLDEITGSAVNVDDTPADGDTSDAISSNWAYDQLYGSWSLADDTVSVARIWTFTAGATFAQWSPVYMKTDGSNGGRVYGYDADETDADTYMCIGRAMTAGTLGNSVTVMLSGAFVFRNDSYSFTYNQDEGKTLWMSDAAAGYEGLTAPSDSGDHVNASAIILQVDNSGTGDFLMSLPMSVDVSVP